MWPVEDLKRGKGMTLKLTLDEARTRASEYMHRDYH